VKRVAVFGSTGSIGTQTLDVVSRLQRGFSVVGLAAGHWSAAFADQISYWQPAMAAVADEGPIGEPDAPTRVVAGPAALERLVTELQPDVVVLGTPGLVGLRACLAALRAGKVVAVANKEPLVSAGALVMNVARRHGGTILPVDSEHSGVWQCLQGEDIHAVREIVLTSSGGAFRDTPLADLPSATPAQALQHPTWSMGPKITVDSATLMNKGLEIIEASRLFDVPASCVSVVVHRQSIVHALVEFIDGSVKAQLSVPDMRLPILNALMYPERVAIDLPRLEIARLGALTFEPVDDVRYPSISLARHAAEAGGTFPTVLNGANEVAVERFLAGSIRFTDIVPLVAETLETPGPVTPPAC
jgi:1-deoxy-D-xylulose-5-phosphate reductoisomerase